MAIKEIDVLGEAIAATEKEIYSEAFGIKEPVLDDTGDRSREDMGEGLEGQHEPEDAQDDDAPESDEDDGAESADDAEGDEDQPRDGKGKFAAKDQKSAEKVDAKDDADKAKPKAGKAEAEEPDADKADLAGKADGKVPTGRLREQTDRTKAAEAERDAAKAEAATVKREVDALNAKLDGILAAMQRQAQPVKAQEPAKVETPPDLFEDPAGFVSHLQKGFQSELSRRDQKLEELRVETSMQIAYGAHKDTFAKAYEAVVKLDKHNPDAQVIVQRIYGSPNPGESLVNWYRNQETLREVGGDPAKYKERITNETREALMKDPEFRKQLLEGLREEASGAVDGKPRSVTRLPKSLNGASGGRTAQNEDPSLYDNSEGSVFQHFVGS